MARDYKQKHYNAKQPYQRRSQMAARTEEPVSSPMKWVWLMALVVTVGLLGGFFVVQHFADKGVKSNETKQGVANAALAASEKAEDVKKEPVAKGVEKKVFEATVVEKPVDNEPKIHYSFYQGLAKTEVVVNAEPISIELPSPYYIQAGSFTEQDAALKEQKRLAGYDQVLQVTSIQSRGKTYYRLRLGPFTDRLVMNRKRNELRKLGVDTLLIRAKQTSDPQTDKDAKSTNPQSEAEASESQ